MGRPHILAIPYPTQGHVMPMMKLSHTLVHHGFQVTFVNSDFNHKRMVEWLPQNNEHGGFLHFVSLSDGMEAHEDRTDLASLTKRMKIVMPRNLEVLINNINDSNNENDRIKCVIADPNQGWALEVAKKMAIPVVAFWPASATFLATIFQIPKLIEEGIIDKDGIPIKNHMFHLCPSMPAMNTADFIWLRMGGDIDAQKSVFQWVVSNFPAMKIPDYYLCNSFNELEPSVFTMFPKVKPIGPLLESSQYAHFWPEDRTCLSWLDQQTPKSVIYVAFGSHTILNGQQFQELALGLELLGQPFLWVVRPDLTDNLSDIYPNGYEARVGSRGKIIAWAPQREVLEHPSVGCFLTHCGWNSTMEAISVGVPLLCWPYFADQMLNKSCICDVWRIGLYLRPSENGLISKEEIKTKVLKLLGNNEIRASVLKYKEMAMKNISKEGVSLKNFEEFLYGFLSNL